MSAGLTDEARARSHSTRRARSLARLEDLEFLLTHHTPPIDAARRTGFRDPETAERFAYRHGRPDLAAQLRREPA